MTEGPTPEELQELIDGRLRGDRLQEVHAALARDPELARYVQDLRSTDIELRRYGHLMLERFKRDGDGEALEEPAAGRRKPAWNTSFGRPATMIAAVVIAVAIGAGGGWWARAPQSGTGLSIVDRIVGEATTAYAYVGSDLGNRFDFAPDRNEAFEKWSSKSFGIRIRPPDLSKAGYAYAGARVFPTSAIAASLLSYRRDDESTISIYCWREGTRQPRFPSEVKHREYLVRFMTTGHLGIAVVAKSRSRDFEATAEAIFQQLSKLIQAQTRLEKASGSSA